MRRGSVIPERNALMAKSNDPSPSDDTASDEPSVDEQMSAAALAAQSATAEPVGGANFLVLHEGVGRYFKDDVIPADAFDGAEAERLIALGAIVGTWRDRTRDVAPPPAPLVRVAPLA